MSNPVQLSDVVMVGNDGESVTLTSPDLVDNGDGTATATGDLPAFGTTSDLTVTPDDQLAFATARIRSYCRWHIFPSITSTVTLDCEGGRLLMLPTLYLTAVNSIALTGDASLVEPGDYSWSEAGMVAGRARSWPCGFRAVTVEFVHGYESLPDELREVAVGAATRVPATFASVAQEAAGGVSRTYAGLLSGTASVSAGWTFAEQQVLDKYRIPNRP